MDRVQEVAVSMNTRRGFAKRVALLWKEQSSILAQGVRSMLSLEKDYPIYIPQGTTIHAGGKLLVVTRSAPHTVRGDAYCIGYIDAPERSYGVYQIHLKPACSKAKFALSLLFVLDNNVFHEHEAWNASAYTLVNG